MIKKKKVIKKPVVNKVTTTKKTAIKKIPNISISDINITDFLPINLGEVIIWYDGKYQILDLPPFMDKPRFKIWRKTIGGVIANDVRDFARNKSKAKFLLIKEDEKKHICRIITEEELPGFESLKLISGQIKDVQYSIVKTLDIDANLKTPERSEIEMADIINVEDISVTPDEESEEDIFAVTPLFI